MQCSVLVPLSTVVFSGVAGVGWPRGCVDVTGATGVPAAAAADAVPFVIRAAVVRVDRFPPYFLFRLFFLVCRTLVMQTNSDSVKIFYKNWW